MSDPDGSPGARLWRARRRIREAADAVTDLIAGGVQLRRMEDAARNLEEAEKLTTEAMNEEAGTDLDRRLTDEEGV